MQEKTNLIKLEDKEKRELLSRVQTNALEPQDIDTLVALLGTFDEVCAIAQKSRGSLIKIRQLLGFNTEKEKKDKAGSSTPSASTTSPETSGEEVKKDKKKALTPTDRIKGLQLVREVVSGLPSRRF